MPPPTVLIRGSASPVVTEGDAAEAATTNPAARLVTVPDAGHMVFWDEQVAAIAALRTELSRTAD